jgi:hypothetical protein
MGNRTANLRGEQRGGGRSTITGREIRGRGSPVGQARGDGDGGQQVWGNSLKGSGPGTLLFPFTPEA